MAYDDISRRISVLKTKISFDHAFWAVIMLHCNFILNETLPFLGATDCAKTIWINPLLVTAISDELFLSLVMHELLHIVLLTEARKNGRNHELWNYATDYAINAIIKDEMGYKIGDDWLYETRFTGMSAEQIYELLLQEQASQPDKQKQAGNGSGEQGQEQGQGGSGGQQQQDQQANGSSSGKGKKGKGSSAAGKGKGKGKDKSKPESGAGTGGQVRIDSHMPMPSGGIEDVKDMIATAEATWNSMPSESRGTLPGSMLQYIKQLLNPKVPWEREFQRYAGETLAQDDFSWSPPSRRYLVHDIYMPSCRSKKIGSLVIAIDTSGSCYSEKQLTAFASETAKLATMVEECIILTADATVRQVIKTHEVPAFLRNMKFEGGGGTSHIPVFEKIRELRLDPELFIGLTDGYSEFPERKPGYNVLWCLTNEGAQMPWGRKVFVDVD